MADPTATIDPAVLARAQAGLDWLEQVCPTEIDRVDLAILDMLEPCVLDQIFGDYLDVVAIEEEANIPSWWMRDHGFSFDTMAGVRPESLLAAWRLLLTERKAAA